MQEIRVPTYDPVAAYLLACRVYPPASDDPVLQGLVRDLLAFYGSDVTGEHVPPTRPFMLDSQEDDFETFVNGDAEDREQILERRIILRLNELMPQR
jgi:hypothetical protein